MLTAAVPLSLGLDYAFHRLFERPFLAKGGVGPAPSGEVVPPRLVLPG